MFGLTVAMVFFEDNYQTGSRVIADDKWKIVKLYRPHLSANTSDNFDQQEGLIRSGNDFYNIMHKHYENDTLYVVLKSNANAQEHFSEIADKIQEISAQTTDLPQNPLNKAIKFLSSLQKIYMPNTSFVWSEVIIAVKQNRVFYKEPQQAILQVVQSLHSPPPDLA